jgi:hypothetical protein
MIPLCLGFLCRQSDRHVMDVLDQPKRLAVDIM